MLDAEKIGSIEKMAGGIAHEINSSLMVIMGYGQLLQLQMGKDDLLEEYTRMILVTAEKTKQFAQNLLMISGRHINNPKQITLNELVKRTETLLPEIVAGSDIGWELILDDKDDVAVMADCEQMDQLFMHLATNARDAMPAGGALTITAGIVELNDAFFKACSCGSAGLHAVIAFSDTGCGMDEKTKNKIFEPFFTTKDIGKGKGIGLLIVHGILKKHKGCIKVDTALNKGTVVKIYLPIVS